MTTPKRRRQAADPEKNFRSKSVACLLCRKPFLSCDVRYNRLCDCCATSNEFKSDAQVAVFSFPVRN
jgi:hypothetical protein